MADILDIGSRLELFVDDWLIEDIRGVGLKMHSPIPREVVMVFDRPWEGPVSLPGVVMKDGGRFKMWYSARSQGGASTAGLASHTAYAESTDGVHWERPALGLLEVAGSMDNNLVCYDTDDSHIGAVYRDENPESSTEESYKAWTVRPWADGRHSIRAFASQDGLRWNVLEKDPLMVAPDAERPWNMFDGENAFFWDAVSGEYVAYLRGWEPVRGGTYSDLGGGIRSVRRTTSPDFRSWSELEFIDMGDSPQDHLYKHTCAPYFRAPHIYLMFPWRFVPERKFHADWESSGISESVFMTSRDGVQWDRRFMEGFIRPGPDPYNWTDRNMPIARGILQTAPGELSIYYGEHYRRPTCRVRRATLRTDGFVSANASYGGGELVTKPLTFSGRELVINYSTSAAGSIQVEVQDPGGQLVEGFALADCEEVFGDEIERVVGWNGGANLGALAGQAIRLRFAMKDADLYSIKFRD